MLMSTHDSNSYAALPPEAGSCAKADILAFAEAIGRYAARGSAGTSVHTSAHVHGRVLYRKLAEASLLELLSQTT